MDYKLQDTMVLVGDIHGDYNYIFPKFNKATNTDFILLGDCGIGFSDAKDEKLKELIAYYTKQLIKRGNRLFLIRGNHDDPKYFYHLEKTKYSNDNWIFLNDYDLLLYKDKTIKCIGGAVSVDRRLRTTDKSYWYDEELRYFSLCEVGDPIDILLTHTCNRKWIDQYLPTPMPDWLRRSFQEDKKLTPDAERENEICSNFLIYYQPKQWFCGHYHISQEVEINDTEFPCKLKVLNINEMLTYNEDKT